MGNKVVIAVAVTHSCYCFARFLQLFYNIHTLSRIYTAEYLSLLIIKRFSRYSAFCYFISGNHSCV